MSAPHNTRALIFHKAVETVISVPVLAVVVQGTRSNIQFVRPVRCLVIGVLVRINRKAQLGTVVNDAWWPKSPSTQF